MSRDTYLKKILGDQRYKGIRESKILLVGAGGIGCELSKNLILSGYGEIHIVDLDTITLSNLNRQFLFRQNDIDKSKSRTVVKAVEAFNYFGAKLVPHHGNIMDSMQFPASWWDQFDYVFNALDNLEARRYVNKMCLFLRTPLMESGTTGYDGQIQPIFPSVTECFECQPKATPKTFPVCTIRSTPSQPIHCITWAKEFLIHQLFDNTSTNIELENLENETEDKIEIENMLKETNELNDLRSFVFEKKPEDFVDELISKIFKVDIERLLNIESLWRFRPKPTPLDFDNFKNRLHSMLSDPHQEHILRANTTVWDTLQNLYVLSKSAMDIQKRLLSGRESFISFDKDDEDTLNFVSAASNLRSNIFNIELKSKFDIKQIAGNIIPAIATTNAIISGFAAIESFNLFYHDKNSGFDEVQKQASTVFISVRPNKFVTSASLVEPNPQCSSCSTVARGFLYLEKQQLHSLTLGDLVNQILETYGLEMVSILLGKSQLIYDPDFEDNIEKKLKDVKGFKSGQLLLIQDDNDDIESVELYVVVSEKSNKPILPSLTLRHNFGYGSKSRNLKDRAVLQDQNDVLLIDDNNVSEVTEVTDVLEPTLKKRRIG